MIVSIKQLNSLSLLTNKLTDANILDKPKSSFSFFLITGTLFAVV